MVYPDGAAPQRVLLVDDSRTIRTLIKLYLTKRGFEYLEVDDGEAGLALLKVQAVDLIIADFNMPKLDGLAFTEQLRRSPEAKLRNLPVILLTASKDPGLKVRAEASGVNAFARKPVTQEELAATVNQWLPPKPAVSK